MLLLLLIFLLLLLLLPLLPLISAVAVAAAAVTTAAANFYCCCHFSDAAATAAPIRTPSMSTRTYFLREISPAITCPTCPDCVTIYVSVCVVFLSHRVSEPTAPIRIHPAPMRANAHPCESTHTPF